MLGSMFVGLSGMNAYSGGLRQISNRQPHSLAIWSDPGEDWGPASEVGKVSRSSRVGQISHRANCVKQRAVWILR